MVVAGSGDIIARPARSRSPSARADRAEAITAETDDGLVDLAVHDVAVASFLIAARLVGHLRLHLDCLLLAFVGSDGAASKPDGGLRLFCGDLSTTFRPI